VFEKERPDSGKLDFEARVPIPFSVFPSAYRNAEVKESTSVRVEGEAKLSQQAPHGGEGHEETHESFSTTVHQPRHRDTHVKEEIHITEQEHLHRPQPVERESVHVREQTRYTQPVQPQHANREEVHIREQTRYRQPVQPQREEVHVHEQTRYRQPAQPQHAHQHQSAHQQQDRVEYQSSSPRTRAHGTDHRNRSVSQPPDFGASKPPQHASPFLLPHFSLTSSSLPKLTFPLLFSYQPSSSSTHTHVEVQDRAYDRHFNTVHGPATDYAPSQIDVSERQFRERTRPIVAEQGYTNLSTHANHQQASRHTRETVTVKDTYPYQGQGEQRVDSRHSAPVRVEESARTTAAAPKHFKRDMGFYDNDGQYHSFREGLHKAAHKVAERVAHPIHPHRHHHHSHEHSNVASKYDDRLEDVIVKEKYTTSVPSVAPSGPVQSGVPVERVVRVNSSSSRVAPAPIARSSSVSAVVPSAPATARKMASANTITIPCHHIRIGDLLILQGRPCQVIRITTSSQTGQHRYLGVDLFTKQLHEESSFISNPAPSVVVQNMLGPVFKQYRVLDIREDGRVVAMTESGDVKQGLPVLDQSALLNRLTESFDNGRGSVRILVINDDGMEMAVDYKVVHGSRL
ncbi:hypothetical protein BDU57DRAFT_448031, partial [Ampelomyces quisqualis]